MNAVERATKWNKEHPIQRNQYARNWKWKHFGLINRDGTPFTYLDYDRAYQIQQGRCKGCGIHQSELKGTLHADHDHQTGKFRFLLCMNCNRTLGHAHDSPTVLRNLATILEENSL